MYCLKAFRIGRFFNIDIDTNIIYPNLTIYTNITLIILDRKFYRRNFRFFSLYVGLSHFNILKKNLIGYSTLGYLLLFYLMLFLAFLPLTILGYSKLIHLRLFLAIVFWTMFIHSRLFHPKFFFLLLYLRLFTKVINLRWNKI